jgi:hypothetical protein
MLVDVVKIIEIRSLDKEQIWMLIKELRILQKVDHPNLVKYVDSFIDGNCLYVRRKFAAVTHGLDCYGIL